MVNFAHYGDDGADHSSRAVLALAQFLCCYLENVDQNTHSVNVGRWCNGREQGYVVRVRPYVFDCDKPEQLNIAWFEHRNTDAICTLVWKQRTINTPTIHDADFGNLYKDKWDITESFRYNEHYKAAEFIASQINGYIELAIEGKADTYKVIR